MRKLTTYTFAFLGILVLFNSCKKEYETIQSIDDAKIQAYIKSNNLTMTKDPSGFYYQVVTPGTGAPMLNKDSVFYTLSISSLSGTNYYTTATYNNEGTYLGYINPASYRTVLEGANRGAKVRVILPSYLAYGKNGTTTVPSNEVIISDINTNVLPKQWQIDDKRITDFLSAKGITATKSPLRVYYKVNTVGTGEVVELSSTITVKYTGRFFNGNVFDSSGETGIALSMTQVIKGWDILLGMQKGAKIRIFVPSDLAYGPAGQIDQVTKAVIIPPSASLDFDIELVDVTN